MEWKLLIVVIGIIAWIISAIQEKAKDADRRVRPQPPPLPPAEEVGAPARRTPEDLQDFLNEVRRRKKTVEAGKREEEPLPAVLVEEAAPVSVVVAPPPRLKPLPQSPKANSEPANPPRWTEVTVVPLSAPAHTLTQKEINVITIPAAVARRPAGQAARDLVELLKHRRGLATAVLLREILDEPLCKRRRRGPRA